MIRAEDLTRRFGDLLAVDRVSLEVSKGSVTGFLGPNGAGKTTTMRMLCGVLTPTSGRAWIDGIDVTSHPERARELVGYLPESAPVYPEMRVDEYLLFRANLYRVSDSRAAILRVVEQCGLQQVHRRIIGQLSKGYRQRVALAAAILHDPMVLILDEPTNHMDLEGVEALGDALNKFDGTVLLVSHYRHFVEKVADHILEMTSDGIRDFSGSYNEYLEKFGEDHLGRTISVSSKKTLQVKLESQQKKLSFDERKNLQRKISKLNKQAARFELLV